jgi:hypothetical protein
MDPEATFQSLLRALADGDHDEAGVCAEALATWIMHGGFHPGGLTSMRDLLFAISTGMPNRARQYAEKMSRSQP